MSANADAHFAIGKTHKTCEDYALAGTHDLGFSYAIVADGCSSSLMTDVGARLLALAAKQSLYADDGDLNHAMSKQTLRLADEWSTAIGLPDTALDATLLTIRETEHGATVDVRGDGIVIARRRAGVLQWWVHDHGGVPGYLSYDRSEGRTHTYLKSAPPQQVRVYRNGIETGSLSASPARLATTSQFFDRAVYDFVMVCSDGAESFQQRGRLSYTPVPLEDVLRQLTAFPGLTGPFVTRRLNRFLKKTCDSYGWHHNDDLAVAAVALEAPSCD